MKNFNEVPWDKLDDYQIMIGKDISEWVLHILTGSEIQKYKFPDSFSIIFNKLLESERRIAYKHIVDAIQDVHSKELS